jgi:hypothetical protein
MKVARHQWPTPVILPTQEAEIRRIMAQIQPKQRVLETLSQKYLARNKAGGVIQVVEHLLNKCEALSSSTSTTIKRKYECCQVWWPMQEDLELKTSLGYIAKPCLKKKQRINVNITTKHIS